MELWHDCGNGDGLFALKFDEDVYIVSLVELRKCRNRYSAMTKELAAYHGCSLTEWVWFRE